MTRVAHGIAIGITLVLISCATHEGHFSLFNKSTEPIRRVVIAIADQTIQLSNIEPNGSTDGSYRLRTDGHYKIHVEFQSGRHLDREIGYVTSGVDFRHEITVTDQNIEITKTEVK